MTCQMEWNGDSIPSEWKWNGVICKSLFSKKKNYLHFKSDLDRCPKFGLFKKQSVPESL